MIQQKKSLTPSSNDLLVKGYHTKSYQITDSDTISRRSVGYLHNQMFPEIHKEHRRLMSREGKEIVIFEKVCETNECDLEET